MVFHIFLVQKAVSVDSFTKMDAKWPRARFGLGRAGWAGPGWLGWAGWLAGLAGWAAWAGLLGWLGWAGLGRDSAWDWFCRLLARISSNRASWVWFSRFLEPTPESVQIELPGIRFIGFWSQGLKVIKSSFLGLVFLTSGANARKSSNQASWDSFCRLLEPRPESHQIESPGTGFLDYWSQRQKSQAKASGAGLAGLGWLAGWAGWLGCLGWLAGLAALGRAGPGLCLGLVLSTSGTKARISSNRAPWVWFSRFLEPTPESV